MALAHMLIYQENKKWTLHCLIKKVKKELQAIVKIKETPQMIKFGPLRPPPLANIMDYKVIHCVQQITTTMVGLAHIRLHLKKSENLFYFAVLLTPQ
eukprot:15348606-Ditylum_brightwellii.AAC.1